MFPRFPSRIALTALLASLAACSDRVTEPQRAFEIGAPATLRVSAACRATEIYQILTWLTPARNAPLDMNGPVTIMLSMSTTRQAFAQQLVLGFASSLTPSVIARLSTPPNPPFASKEAAVAVLVADLMQCVGLEPADAPPTGAYLPSGALKVMDGAGGQLVTGDLEAGISVPAGAVTGPHLFSISTVPTGVTPPGSDGPTTCLPPRAGVIEVGRCYDFAVSPDVGAHSAGAGFGGSGVYAAVCSPGIDGQEVHNHLQLAKVDHGSPSTFTIYPRVLSSFTASLSCNLGDGPLPPTASVTTRAWSAFAHGLAALTRPFRPSTAYAADGVGSLLLDFTHASLVYQTIPMTLTPSSATVPLGSAQAFTAASPRAGPYVWSVNGSDVGANFNSASGTMAVAGDGLSATYTAPGAITASPTVTVCVRRLAAAADKGCSTITLLDSFVGSWSGTISNGTLTQPVTLNVTSQTGNTVVGELLVATFSDPAPYNDQRSFTGTVTGATLDFGISPFVAITSISASLTKSGNALSGTMTEIGGGNRVFAANLTRVGPFATRMSAGGSGMRSLSTDGTSGTSSAPAFGRAAP